MKAMIFAAGFGTRLRPLTLSTPKPLIPLLGKPVLDWVLAHLARQGVREALLNAHYLKEQIAVYAKRYQGPIQLQVIEEPEILGTGGGLWNAREWFGENEDFLICNGDILTDLPLHDFMQAHQQSGALVSLAVNQARSPGMLLLDESMQLAGRVNVAQKIQELCIRSGQPFKEWGFSGFHLVSPRIFNQVEPFPFDILELYLKQARQGALVQGWDASKSWFLDIGSPEQLAQAEQEARARWGALD